MNCEYFIPSMSVLNCEKGVHVRYSTSLCSKAIVNVLSNCKFMLTEGNDLYRSFRIHVFIILLIKLLSICFPCIQIAHNMTTEYTRDYYTERDCIDSLSTIYQKKIMTSEHNCSLFLFICLFLLDRICNGSHS